MCVVCHQAPWAVSDSLKSGNSDVGSCSCTISCEMISFLSGLEVALRDLCMPDKPWTTKLCPNQKALLQSNLSYYQVLEFIIPKGIFLLEGGGQFPKAL